MVAFTAFSFISRWFPVFALPVLILNLFIFRLRIKRRVTEHPALAEGYRKFLWGFLICTGLPWLVLIVGALNGS